MAPIARSLTPARRLLATYPFAHAVRQHWGIENRLHDVRDVTFNEDRSTVRSGAAPQTLATCPNLAIALLRRASLVPTRCAPTRPSRASPLRALHDEIALTADPQLLTISHRRGKMDVVI